MSYPFKDDVERERFRAQAWEIKCTIHEDDLGARARVLADEHAQEYTFPVVIRDMFSSVINRRQKQVIAEIEKQES